MKKDEEFRKALKDIYNIPDPERKDEFFKNIPVRVHTEKPPRIRKTTFRHMAAVLTALVCIGTYSLYNIIPDFKDTVVVYDSKPEKDEIKPSDADTSAPSDTPVQGNDSTEPTEASSENQTAVSGTSHDTYESGTVPGVKKPAVTTRNTAGKPGASTAVSHTTTVSKPGRPGKPSATTAKPNFVDGSYGSTTAEAGAEPTNPIDPIPEITNITETTRDETHETIATKPAATKPATTTHAENDGKPGGVYYTTTTKRPSTTAEPNFTTVKYTTTVRQTTATIKHTTTVKATATKPSTTNGASVGDIDHDQQPSPEPEVTASPVTTTTYKKPVATGFPTTAEYETTTTTTTTTTTAAAGTAPSSAEYTTTIVPHRINKLNLSETNIFFTIYLHRRK